MQICNPYAELRKVIYLEAVYEWWINMLFEWNIWITEAIQQILPDKFTSKNNMRHILLLSSVPQDLISCESKIASEQWLNYSCIMHGSSDSCTIWRKLTGNLNNTNIFLNLTRNGIVAGESIVNLLACEFNYCQWQNTHMFDDKVEVKMKQLYKMQLMQISNQFTIIISSYRVILW